ncbi:hypothetical protein QYE76_060072 [Lolium multiflorum]|uniref:Retrotransposon gag domain-containing protein n=1 Tax=Lolium multiflorum TaxID=4521 RepID=A0AAD8S1H8_LOLMU|nr:hypothetical protein QYE76_060072 [Lolium multiflorum]
MDLTDELKKKYDEVKAILEADLIDFHRTRSHGIGWKGFSPPTGLRENRRNVATDLEKLTWLTKYATPTNLELSSCSWLRAGKQAWLAKYATQRIFGFNSTPPRIESVPSERPSLTGSAFGWYTSLPPDSIRTWKQLEEQFHMQYHSEASESRLADLAQTHQKRGETVTEYIQRFRNLRNRCYSVRVADRVGSSGPAALLRTWPRKRTTLMTHMVQA